MRAALVHKNGFRTWFHRDAKGALVATTGRRAKLEVLKDGYVVRGLGDERIYRFDRQGWITSRQGPGSLWIEFKYAAQHRLSTVEGPWGVISLERDAHGHLTAIRAPGRRRVRYTHDAQGNLTKVVRGDHYETYGYDAAGRLSWLADGKALVQYDAVGRVIALRGAGVAPVRARYLQLGAAEVSAKQHWTREATITCGTKTETFRYSRDSRTVLKVDALGGETLTVVDERARLIRLVAPDGRVMTQTFDARGRIATRTTPQGTSRIEYGSSFTERPTRITLADGRKVTFDYDMRGNLIKVTAPGGAT
jgi:YD repeat-containing protein